MTLGHKFLLDNFGPTSGVPRTGWQIDPFGHSITSTALMASMGFDALFMCRIDWEDKLERQLSQRLETLWDSSPSLGSAASTLWTSITVSHYGSPSGFCIDDGCDNGAADPIMDDPALQDYNVPAQVKLFMDQVLLQAAAFQGQDVMVTLGGDFLYTQAGRNFKQIDKLIKYANAASQGNYTLKYSTPAEYTAAKLASSGGAGLSWPVKVDDFFPYADYFHAYWVGFFTSRPLLKRMVRTASAALQAAKQIECMAGLGGAKAFSGPTKQLSQAVALAQHHDAVAGTSMQHVTYDYALRISKGLDAAEGMMNEAFAALVSPNGAQPPALVQCRLASNESLCAVTQEATTGSGEFAPLLVLVYNPQAHLRSERVSVPVERADLSVLDANQQPVLSQVIDHEAGSQVHYTSRRNILARNRARTRAAHAARLRRQREQREGAPDEDKPSAAERIQLEPVPSRYTLHFAAEAVQPLGVESFFIVQNSTQANEAPIDESSAAEDSPAAIVTLANDVIALSFSSATGLLLGYTELGSGLSFALTQDWIYYESFVDPTGASQNAGAYISRFSNNNVPFAVEADAASGLVAELSLSAQGPLVWEATQVFSDWLVQSVRLTRGSSVVEIEYAVGPVPLVDSDGVARGKEVVSRFTLNATASTAGGFDPAAIGLDNEGFWSSDSNGREMVQRQRDARASFNMSHEEPVASNFVPMTALAFIRDPQSQLQLTVLTDRSQGCASLSNASLSLMVHRRLVADDNKGVHEPLNETASITPYPNPQRIGPGITVVGTHQLILAQRSSDSAPSFASAFRPQQADTYLPLVLSYASLPGSIAEYVSTHATNLSWSVILPPNLDLLSLQSWDDGAVLVRLSHSYGVGEDAALSGPVQFDLTTLFPGKQVRATATRHSHSGVRRSALEC